MCDSLGGAGLAQVQWGWVFILVCAGSHLSVVAVFDTGVYYIWRDEGCPLADKPPAPGLFQREKCWGWVKSGVMGAPVLKP